MHGKSEEECRRGTKEECSMTEQRNGFIQSSSMHYGHFYYML